MSASHLAIASLLTQPLTHQQIALATGKSIATVGRIAQKLAKATKEAPQLEAYQRLLLKRVPLQKRVDTVDKVLAKVDSNPFAAMRALEYADGVNGLAPKQQQKEQDSGNQGPSLVFPAGTTLDIGIRARTPKDTD